MSVTGGPIRTCVGCGRRDAQRILVRVQIDQAGAAVVVDRAGAGRSAYVHTDKACTAALGKSRGLARSLRVAVGRAERAHLRLGIEERISRTQPSRAASEGAARGE